MTCCVPVFVFFKCALLRDAYCHEVQVLPYKLYAIYRKGYNKNQQIFRVPMCIYLKLFNSQFLLIKRSVT